MLEDKDKNAYPEESVGRLMSLKIPVCAPDASLEEIKTIVFGDTWETAHSIYVVDPAGKLRGVIDLAHAEGTGSAPTARQLMQPAEVTLSAADDQEKAVFYAIKHDVVSIPVTSRMGVLEGVITAHAIIDIMHAEHVEDSLLTAGIDHKSGSLLHRVTDSIGLSVRSRAPWLVIGTVAGLGLSLLTSQFEASLQQTIAIAYFIPVVAYVAGSVGAQSSVIAVRSLALTKVLYVPYLGRELLIGMYLGAIVGILGLAGALVISQSLLVAATVALSLFLTCIVATMLAALIPFLLALAKKDPAMGSGPLATASLDIISITLYFLLATSILV